MKPLLEFFNNHAFIGLAQSMYIETIVKNFGTENFKKGFIPTRYGVQGSKKQSPKTLEDRMLMEKIPHASTIEELLHEGM